MKEALLIGGGFLAGLILRNLLSRLLQKGLRWLADRVQ